jgi:hypothetical protein
MNSNKYLFLLLCASSHYSFCCYPPKNDSLKYYNQKEYAKEFPGASYDPQWYVATDCNEATEEEQVFRRAQKRAAPDAGPAVEKEPTPPQSARSSAGSVSNVQMQITITTSSGNVKELLKQLIPYLPGDQ